MLGRLCRGVFCGGCSGLDVVAVEDDDFAKMVEPYRAGERGERAAYLALGGSGWIM
ncbi:MAG: hypothetical protein ACYDHP_00175 [Ferrimicrobium sp.]